VSKPCSYATSPLPVPGLIMKQAIIRLRLVWIAKVSAFGPTEPHRIHSTLVGYHNPTFLASSGRLHPVAAPRACGACDISRMIYNRLVEYSNILEYMCKLMFHICACIDQVGQAVKASFSQAAAFCLSLFSVYISGPLSLRFPHAYNFRFRYHSRSMVLCISSLSF
jgi:hypothetical protein